MQNTTMLRLSLYLNGHFAGRTIKLGGTQFTEGKVTLYGPAAEVHSLSNYLSKCFQAWPEGKTIDPVTHEIIYEEVVRNGSSTIQQKGLSDVQPKIREEERPPEKVPANVGTGPASSDLDERGDNTSRLGHEDPRLSSPDERFNNTSAAKVDPEQLLEAMGKLDPDVKEHWRADGQPRIDAVAGLYGSEGLTRKDLQAVWPELTREVKKGEDTKEK
jgi:hypothetical protein